MDIHKALGLQATVPCFDMNQSCDGMVYGLWVASKLRGNVILVCTDMLRTDEANIDSLIFSDAAVACLVNVSNGFSEPLFYNDPSGINKLQSDSTTGLMKMDGGFVYDYVVKNVPPLVMEYVNRYPEIDLLCSHQANMSMLRLIEMRTKFTGRSLHSIAEYGNQSMISIASAIALNEDKILGKKILLCTFGAGMCSALMAVRWQKERCTRIVELEPLAEE